MTRPGFLPKTEEFGDLVLGLRGSTDGPNTDDADVLYSRLISAEDRNDDGSTSRYMPDGSWGKLMTEARICLMNAIEEANGSCVWKDRLFEIGYSMGLDWEKFAGASSKELIARLSNVMGSGFLGAICIRDDVSESLPEGFADEMPFCYFPRSVMGASREKVLGSGPSGPEVFLSGVVAGYCFEKKDFRCIQERRASYDVCQKINLRIREGMNYLAAKERLISELQRRCDSSENLQELLLGIKLSDISSLQVLSRCETALEAMSPGIFGDRLDRMVQKKKNKRVTVETPTGTRSYDEWSTEWEDKYIREAMMIFGIKDVSLKDKLGSVGRGVLYEISDRIARLALVCEVEFQERSSRIPLELEKIIETFLSTFSPSEIEALSPDDILEQFLNDRRETILQGCEKKLGVGKSCEFYPDSINELTERVKKRFGRIESEEGQAKLRELGINPFFVSKQYKRPMLVGIAESYFPLPSILAFLPGSSPDEFSRILSLPLEISKDLATRGITTEAGVLPLLYGAFPWGGELDSTFIDFPGKKRTVRRIKLFSEKEKKQWRRRPMVKVRFSPQGVQNAVQQLPLGDPISEMIKTDTTLSIQSSMCGGSVDYPRFIEVFNRKLSERILGEEVPWIAMDTDPRIRDIVFDGIEDSRKFIDCMCELGLLNLSELRAKGDCQEVMSVGDTVFRYYSETDTESQEKKTAKYRYLCVSKLDQRYTVFDRDDPLFMMDLSEFIASAREKRDSGNRTELLFLAKNLSYFWEYLIGNILLIDDGVFSDYPPYKKVLKAAKILGWEDSLVIYPYSRSDEGYAGNIDSVANSVGYSLAYYYLYALVREMQLSS